MRLGLRRKSRYKTIHTEKIRLIILPDESEPESVAPYIQDIPAVKTLGHAVPSSLGGVCVLGGE